MNKNPLPSSDQVLNSWKEIAAYLNRGVRTVQRWERELSLPVRRPHNRSRSAVIALRSDLDVWLKACPLQEPRAPEVLCPAVRAGVGTRELLATSSRLRAEIAHSRSQVALAIKTLVGSVGRMVDCQAIDVRVVNAPIADVSTAPGSNGGSPLNPSCRSTAA